MKNLQKVFMAASFAGVLGSGVYEARQKTNFAERVKTADQREQDMVAELSRWELANGEKLQEITRNGAYDQKLRIETLEIHRLRGQVSLLQNQSAENHPRGTEDRLKALLSRTEALKNLPARFPEYAIPEIAMLTEEVWMELTKASMAVPMDDDVSARRAFSLVRRYAKLAFSSRLHEALRKYLSNSKSGELPENILELKPYFKEPVDDSMLRRYEVVQTGGIGRLDEEPGTILLAERAPADPEFDTRMTFIGTNQVRADDIHGAKLP
jgi:hypothetical protein